MEMGLLFTDPHTCRQVSVVENGGETETIKAERTVKELEQVSDKQSGERRSRRAGMREMETAA